MNLQTPEKFKHLEINEDYQKVLRHVYELKRDVIITGNAGVGKSSLLHLMKALDEQNKINSLYVAPTGVAAVNIEGATIHSTFGLGIDMRNPRDVYPKQDVAEVISRTSKIIIDEASMVRADLLDSVHYMCQKVLHNDKLFGGIQIILVGDFFQLTPIIGKSQEENFFFSSMYGENPFFFASDAYTTHKDQFTHIELKHIYRQNDGEFKDILNRLRVGRHTQSDLNTINNRITSYTRYRKEHPDGVYIAPYNKIVDETNNSALDRIPEKDIFIMADIIGYINPKNFMAPERLHLKRGCKIMMLTNDPSGRFQNGTVGEFVSVVGHSTIKVRIKGYTIDVNRYEFAEYRYQIQNKRLTKVKKGSFSQFPIKLAYALSVHKAQGLTFTEGYLDFGSGLFAEHSAYVAFSRFTNLEGVGIRKPLRESDIKINPYVIEFMSNFNENVVEEAIEREDIFDDTSIDFDDDIPF